MIPQKKGIEWIEHHPTIGFIIGFFAVIIGYIIARVLFFESSIAMLFLTALIVMPLLTRILKNEEKITRKNGFKNFFKNHQTIFELYLFIFIGIFVGYLLLGFVLPAEFNNIFSYQVNQLELREGLDSELIDTFISKYLVPTIGQVSTILINNLIVMFILFGLSLFYGSGAIFLTILNASVFASFIIYVIRYLQLAANDIIYTILIFNIHLLPEVSGFLAGAIGGGVLSKAFIFEKIGTKAFKNVFKDAIYILFVGTILIFIGAFLEVYVTPVALQALFS